MSPRPFKVVVFIFVTVFSVCVLAFLFAGVMNFLRPTGPGGTAGTGGFAVGFSTGFLRGLAVAVIVFVVGLFGLTRLGRFLK